MLDRIDKQTLLDELQQWNSFLKRKVHLIACGGTALTLLGIKPSTKDVDFMVPVEAEHKYLIKTIKKLGYEQKTASGWQRVGHVFRYDLFSGNKIHTTELLRSPLEEGQHILLKEFSHIYVGVLNEYDLITSKLFRGTNVDFDDCLMLVKAQKGTINIEHLQNHFREMAGYDISEDRIIKQLDHFLDLLRKNNLYAK
ncbi:MAG: hypothetical protein ISR96_05185 [Nitrospira sp.]|nr:hypothetical protein [Candidatus Brocadiales bacterium]MBL7048894.1 hypothetical protein [Nitrospira sp.]